MQAPISNLSVLLASMEPVLNDGVFVYTSVPHGTDISRFSTISTMREVEGVTLVVSEKQALAQGLTPIFRCAWITLNVHSDLNAVGLTAAFAAALGNANISCNVVAGTYHDHIFVPIESAQRAMAAIRSLQEASRLA